MEDLISAVNQILDILKGNNLSFITSIIFALVPILLTVISIILSVRMDMQNKTLQKMIADRDSRNQTRQIILEIYNAYFTGFRITSQAKENIEDIFISDQSYYKWATDLETAFNSIAQMYNQAKLLIRDNEFIVSLKKAFESFGALNHSVGQYIATGIPSQMINNAWQKICTEHQIFYGSYYFLLQNRSLYEEFRKLCKTTYTDEIQKNLRNYINIVDTNEFDDQFKKYISMQQL
ncbi:MAG: hypothetical protein J6I53_05490 [Treponema sp.]|nr:hypothetical protein [Treponema sp.]